MNLNSHLRRCSNLSFRYTHIPSHHVRRGTRLQSLTSRSTQQPAQVQPQPGTPAAEVDQVANLFEHNYERPTLFTLDFFRRAFKFSLAGFVILAGGTWAAFEGAHLWVEHIELKPEDDPDGELRRWGWIEQSDKWSGGAEGGTDPALGYSARHAVRSAWMAENWGTGSSIISNKQIENYQHSRSQAVEARLEYAHDFLNIALNAALSHPSSVQPHTLPELLARHANTLERMGSPDMLYQARSEYERVWSITSGRGAHSAGIALKIGNLCARLDDAPEARDWWARSLLLATGRTTAADVLDPREYIPTSLPESPLSQRTLTAALTSISAHYAQSGNLKEAKEVQERGVALLAKDRHRMANSSSPAHSLHELFLKHRSSLLLVHLAEVVFALKESPQVSLVHLREAAERAEQVAFTLTGLPFTHPDSSSHNIPHPPSSNHPLHGSFKDSRTLQKPASDLLRDARRSAAESWRLSGVLYEMQGKTDSDSMTNALRCYERALGWVGISTDSHGGAAQPGESILEAEWKTLWGDYVRVRDTVREERSKRNV